MIAAAWLTGNALTFDTETTGKDPHEARIVTAAVIEVGPEGVARREQWLINCGVEIPAEATAIHGVTTEMSRGGIEPAIALAQVAELLREGWGRGLPVIIMSASYDLTALLAEAGRIGLELPTFGPVIDPLVIDRGCDPYRRGKRTLTALAEHYGVRLDGAHSSDGDALAAARVVWKQARRYGAIKHLTLDQMQQWQADAHREWAVGFEAHLRTQGKQDVISTDWPVRQLEAA